MVKSVPQRIAVAVGAVLLCSAALQLLVVRWIINRETIVIREGLMTLGLRILRLAADEKPLDGKRLRAEFKDQDMLALGLYDAEGRLTALSREDVASPGRLSPSIRESAEKQPNLPVWLEPYSVSHDNVAVIRVPGNGPVRYVSIIDRWAPARVKRALRYGVLAGGLTSILVGLVATALLARHIRARLKHAESTVERMTQGDLSARLPDFGDNDVGKLARLFNSMADTVQRHIKHMEEEESRRRRGFADWTHEISTPLTGIIAHLESLQMEGSDEDKRRRYIEIAYDRALALKALTDDLCTLSQMDFEGLSLDLGPVDPEELVLSEVKALEVRAKEEGIKVEVGVLSDTDVECPESSKTPLQGDRRRLGQVLRNLLTNAAQHTPSGGSIRVRISRSTPGQLAIEISDQGTGIAPEHLARIGEPFYRADDSRSRKTGGRGLGVSIAKAITEAHGGALSMESTVGVGTKVKVELPLPGPRETTGALHRPAGLVE